MATVNGITVTKAQQIENASVVSGAINSGNGHLILTTAGGTTIDAGVVRPSDVAPAGMLGDFATLTAPTGWLACDGALVSRTTYAALYSALGGASSPHGQGDGSTTFGVPNFKGLVLVHRDTAQTEFDTLNERGGAKTHTMTTSEMPSHSHNGQTQVESVDHAHSGHTAGIDSNHNHNIAADQSFGVTAGGTNISRRGGPETGNLTGLENQDHGHAFSTGGRSAAHVHAVDAQGGGTAHSILQPYAVILRCIKT